MKAKDSNIYIPQEELGQDGRLTFVRKKIINLFYININIYIIFSFVNGSTL